MYVQFYSIYVDAVINHMTGGGSGVGSNNSSFNGETQRYPGVPYSNEDFHGHADCPTSDLNIWVSRLHIPSEHLLPTDEMAKYLLLL